MSAEREYAAIAAATAGVGVVAIVGATKTDHTGPILAFVGALIVAVITAYTSDRRLRAQLGHDRRLHDLDGLRDLLGRASSLMYTGSRPLAGLMNLVEGQKGEIAGDLFEKCTKHVDPLLESQPKFNEMAGELLIHFTKEDPLFVAFNAFGQALQSAVSRFLEDPPAEELTRHLDEVMGLTATNANLFREAARKAVSYRAGD